MKGFLDPRGIHVVSLMRGDKIRECLEQYAQQEELFGAIVSGASIGAVEDPELAVYRLAEKKYISRVFPGIYELQFGGNLSLKDGKPFLHAHVTISGEDFIAYGGHLVEGKIGVLGDFFIIPLEHPIRRVMNIEVGLPRWEPGL